MLASAALPCVTFEAGPRRQFQNVNVVSYTLGSVEHQAALAVEFTVPAGSGSTNGPKVLAHGRSRRYRPEPHLCAQPTVRYRCPVIEFDDFTRVDMRVGRILAADPFPEARKPSYRLRIDFGPELGERLSSAQLTVTYPDPAALVGRQVVALVNVPPRRIAGFASEVLVLGAMADDGNVYLLAPAPESAEGLRIG